MSPSPPPPPHAASPAGPAPRSLDAAALARLAELDPDGSHGVMRRVLQAFETSLARLLGQLAAAGDGAQPTQVAHVAHTLKSSAASVGALELAEVCARIEKSLRGNADSAGLHADIEQLHREGEAALVAVRTILRP